MKKEKVKKKEKPKKSEAFEKQNLAILIILLIFFMITIAFYFIFNVSLKDNAINKNETINQSQNNSTIASRIIDGDTFELASGEIIRLICIDAPEKNKNGFDESRQFLSDLILNRQIRLEKDVSDKDSYGRLLRYVYVNSISQQNEEIFVNKELVKQGYAALFPYGNDTKRCNEINSS
ncbi:MAG: thermonuclease family protein [Nanoarchaeota archaeon]